MSGQCSQTSRMSNMPSHSLRLCRCMAEPRRPRNSANRLQRHQNAVESLTRGIQTKLSEIEQDRMHDGSSWKHVVDKGIQDIQDVAARTGVAPREQAPLSAYSDVWTFPVCLVTFSTLLITWASVLADSPYPTWACGTVGFFIGAVFSLAHRAAIKRVWTLPDAPLNVVITGGTRGLGRALVREFLRNGDNVYVAARSSRGVAQAVAELQAECVRPKQLAGLDCDVSRPLRVSRLVSRAQAHFPDGCIDVWINNAGVSGSFKGFLEATPEDLEAVTHTNLLGALLCTRAAATAMAQQARPGHIFNMDGAGADFSATPMYAAYGATKAGIAHVMGSVAAEVEAERLHVGVHTLSPGMVLTDLILDGATNQNKQVFNILCEQPEVAAAYLVPRARTVAARNGSRAYIRYLTGPKAIMKFLSAPLLLGRYFNADGAKTYVEDEEARLDCKSTERAMSKSRRRGAPLRLTYAASLCLAVLLLSLEPGSLELPLHLPGWFTATVGGAARL
eukprot:jgi/Ulvmu1/10777/UM069_0011.1